MSSLKSLFSSCLLLVMLFSSLPAQAMMLDEFLADPVNRAAYENFPEDVKAEMQRNDELIKASNAKVLENRPKEAISCFDHYQPGSVAINFDPTTETPVAGTDFQFTGVLTNKNPYPIVEGTLFVKVFRLDQEDQQLAILNGYPLVDQFIAKDDVVIPAGASLPVDFTWTIPEHLAQGDYYAALYFGTHDRYNITGLMFMDDITGGQIDFAVQNPATPEPTVYLDRNAVTINDFEYNFSQPPRLFKRDEAVEVSVTVVNPRDEEVYVPLTWQLAPWGDLVEEKTIDTKTETVYLKAGESKEVTYTVEPHDNTVSYVVVSLEDKGVQSIQNIRFSRDGVEETRLEFPTILSYPLRAGEENGLFVCAHTTNLSIVEGNEVTLDLTDLSGAAITSYTYQGHLPVDMTGIIKKFVPSMSLNSFTLTTTLKRNGAVVESVSQTYRCEDLDPGNCAALPADTSSSGLPSDRSDILLYGLIVIVGFGLLYFLAYKFLMKKHLLASLLALSLLTNYFTGGVTPVEAATQTIPYTFTSKPPSFPSCQTGTYYEGNGSIVYTANVNDLNTGSVVPSGSTVAVGTPLRFNLQVYGDATAKAVSWVGPQAGCWGSPVGAWVPGAARSATTPLSINPPTIDVVENNGGSPIFTCSSMTDCTVTGTGAGTATVTYGATYGRYYYDYTVEMCSEGICWGDPRTEVLAFPVPATSINFTFSGVVTNNAPGAPTISGPATGTTGSPLAFSFSATDSDGDQVRYGIDWDNNGTVNTWLPSSSSYVNSGVSSAASITWPTAGTYTFRALTVDSKGTASGWSAAKTVTVSNAPSVNLNFQQ